MLVIDAHGQAVARKERRALIPRHTQHPVAGIEAVIERFGAGRIAVVDLVAPPVVEKAQSSGGLSVVVAQRERSHAAGNALFVVENGRRHGSRILGVEMREVHIGINIPLPGNLIIQLGIAAVLLEAHVPAMSVGAIIGPRHRTGETPVFQLVRGFGLQRVVGAVTGVNIGFHAVLDHFSRHDIDYAAHGVRTVQHRSGAAHDFDPVGQHRLIGIGNGMPHQPHVLGMAVDQHQQTRCGTSADTAQRHLSGRAA